MGFHYKVNWMKITNLFIAAVETLYKVELFIDNSDNRLNASPRFSSKYSSRGSYLLPSISLNH